MDDLISRQAAIDAMQKLEDEDIEAYSCLIPEGFHAYSAIKALKALPAALSEQKTGKWIKQVDESINAWWYECSECGDYPPKDLYGHDDLSKYCPRCGAKMEADND